MQNMWNMWVFGCYFIFEKSFANPNGTTFYPYQQSNTRGLHSRSNPQMVASMAQQQLASNTNPQMNAFLAPQTFNQDTNWYPDSGASNHVTQNFNNLAVSSDYMCGNKVKIGNVATLQVLHTGSSFVTPSTMLE